jgi:hypothetical protein
LTEAGVRDSNQDVSMTATTPSPAKITKRKSVKLLLKKLGGTFSSGTDALRTHSSSEERTPRYPMSDTVEKLEKNLGQLAYYGASCSIQMAQEAKGCA